MKLFKNLINIISFAVLLVIAYFVWNFLQKQEIIVTNATKSVITELKAINKLETAEMTIVKIMEAKKDLIDIFPSISFDNLIQDALFQDKMIFELEWKVVAGIDFEKIETWDIRTNIDGSVSINLPEVEILHVIIDENSKPYDRRIWVLTKGNVEMETKIRNKAKEDMRTEAQEAGILTVAQENARISLWELLGEFDVKIN